MEIGDDKEMRNKFLACAFLAGVDHKKCGEVVNDLNNAHLTGQQNYPTMAEAAVMMLSNYASEKQIKDESLTGVTETGFVQKNRKKNMKCFKCQKKGHFVNECPEDCDESDEESSARLNRNRRETNHVNWSRQMVSCCSMC